MTPKEEAEYGRKMAELVKGEQDVHREFLHSEIEEIMIFEVHASHRRFLARLMLGSLLGLNGYAREISISPQAARKTAAPLISHGYVRKDPPEIRQGRSWLYSITQKGKEALDGQLQ